MYVGADTLYGNEWIDVSRQYFKIKVASDGLYRVPSSVIAAAGISTDVLPGSQYRLFHNGREVPIYVSAADQPLGPTDFIEFYGQKNRNEIDQHLFENPETENLNPKYSMFNDTSAYFLTWQNTGIGARYAPEVNDILNPPAKETFCIFTDIVLNNSALVKRKESSFIAQSWFNGEGFSESPTVNSTVQLTPTGLVASGPDASLKIRYACDLGYHIQVLKLNDVVATSDSFYNWKINQHQFSVSSATLASGVKVDLVGTISTTDRHSISYIEFRYPRTFDVANADQLLFELPADNNATERYLEISGVNGGANAVLLDLTTSRRYLPVLEGGLLKFKIKNSANGQPLQLLISGAGTRTVGQINPIIFRDYTALNGNYIILTHKALMAPISPGGQSPMEDYADYRSSIPGGGYKVVTVDVEELYEQFSYGVAFHPMAIRNFAHYVKQKWQNPAYLFIVGKGLNYDKFRTSNVQAPNNGTVFFVPVYGTPGTDWSFVMRKGGISRPLFAVGRLAVTKPFEIQDYLNKIIERDAALAAPGQNFENKAWTKRVVHTSGGGNASERQLIANYIDDLSSTVKQGRVGAEVVTLYKNSNDPVQSSGYSKLQEAVNQGVFNWVIFGHSSPTVVDYDIGTATGFQNNPHYPVMLILGCYSGLASQIPKGLGEEYILAPHSGAINYIATCNYGLTDALHFFAKTYYERMGGIQYGESIGNILKGVIDTAYNNPSFSIQAVLHQMVLQGDPAVMMPGHPGPDYIFDNQSIKINPNPVTINGSKFKVDFDLLNLGENKSKPVQIRIEQKWPNDSILVLAVDTITPPAFRQKYQYEFPADQEIAAGYNRLLLRIDDNNQIEELPFDAENNNDLVDGAGKKGLEVYFFANQVTPISPPNFAVIPDPNPVLHAFVPFSSGAPRRFLFEIDTLESFTSPYLLKKQVSHPGGNIEWKPSLNLIPGTVAYWRVANDNLIDNKIVWQNSSFVYIDSTSVGWNQSHYGQFIQNSLNLLDSVPAQRILDFTINQTNAVVKVAYRGRGFFPGLTNGFDEGFLSDFQWGNQAAGRAGLALMLSDPKTGHVIYNPENGPYNPAPGAKRSFFFFETKDSLQRIGLMNFIENEIPDKSTVGLFSVLTATDQVGYAPQSWASDSIAYGKNLFQVFESLNAKRIRSLANFSPVSPAYGLIFRKGDPSFEALETLVTSPDSVSTIRKDFPAKWFTGSLETTIIGPAKQWKSLSWTRSDFDNPAEKAKMFLYGLRANAQDTLLYELNQPGDTTLAPLNAGTYPFLKVRYETTDSLRHSSADLKKLRVLYEPYPEGSIDPLAFASFYKDSLEQGEPLRASLAFFNISATPMDSLLVRFRIENSAGQKDIYQKFKVLNPGDSAHVSVIAPTLQLKGDQRLLIDANPDQAQPELFHGNNIFIQSFFVKPDRRNPVLDVTVDGTHIMDGDLISPKPEMVVSVKDDNAYLAITDTSAISLRIDYPDGSSKPLLFNDPQLLFIPADPTALPKKNVAKLEWRPIFTQDGEYKLTVVGRDASGNSAGNLEYAINFKVITKSSISNVLNYPNPFSTNTCFVYTMTGAETPTRFRIQIMTVSGKVVREITESEFGPLQAGVHQSDFCWDGKDEFGDQLANGVYLYRIVAKKADGSDFEFFEQNQIDSMFKHGFGKMVLMR